MLIASEIRKATRRRFVDTSSSDEAWQIIHRVADKNYPLFRQLFLNAWDRWRRDVPLEELITFLSGGNVDQSIAITLRPWTGNANDLLESFRELAWGTTIDAAAATQPVVEGVIAQATGVSLGIDFSSTNTRVFQIASLYAGEFITLIGETERQAIRELVIDALAKGQPAPQTGREIREFIGLTRRQAQTLIRFRESLQAVGIPPRRIEERVAARARRMIRQRARVIAREETMRAAVEGQRQLWLDAETQGLVVAGTVRRFWVVTPDDRLCEICRPIPRLNQDGVGLHEPYATPVGPKLIAHAHITCRCAENFVIMDL